MSDIRALSLRLSGVNVPADHSKNKKPQAFYYTVQPCTRNRRSDFSTSASFPDAGRRKRKGSAMRLVDFRSRGPLQKTNSVVICISTEKSGGFGIMFQALRTCFTTGGICPKREDVVPLCVTEGFCGGKRGPKTGIERMVWAPLHFLDESDVQGSLERAGAAAPGVQGHKLDPYPPLYTVG